MSELELSKAIEVIKDKLYYMVARSVPADTVDIHFFTVDDVLHYWPFFQDFGPLSLGNLYKFSCMINAKLADKALLSKRLVLYSGPHMHRRANAVYLLAAYTLLFRSRTPEEAYRPFAYISPPLAPWHDASPGVDSFHLTCLDVLRGIAKARECRFFSFDRFDIEEYEHYERVENGDMNWIVEGRFLAFAGPHDSRMSSPEGYHTTAVDDLLPYFKAKGVSAVVRLNKKYYNEKRFTAVGIDHYDMYYLDGSNPPEPILQRFLATAEGTSNAMAVHCKAGLGRTGTCIGAYLMKHYRLTAREVIGWMRVCRPGSVIGPQQQFLEEIQHRMWEEGEMFRRIKRLPSPVPGSLLAEWQVACSKSELSPSSRLADAEDDSLTQSMSHLKVSSRSSGTAFAPATSTKVASLPQRSASSKSISAGVDLVPGPTSTPTAGRRSGTSSPSSGISSLTSMVKSTVGSTRAFFNGSSSRTVGADESATERDTPTTMLSLHDEKSTSSSTPTASRQRAAAATGFTSAVAYASPGSSPISTNMLRARSRAGPADRGDRDYDYYASGAGAVPSAVRASIGPSVSPLSVPSARPGVMGSPARTLPMSSSVKGGFGTPSSPEAELVYSQGDMLRSAKTRSPMLSATASPGSNLRFAGSGVVTQSAPKSPGGFPLSSSTPIAVGGSGSPSLARYGLRTRA